jgi:hypothetical protein
MRWPDETLAAIDDWRQKQADAPARPQAIRRLVELALNAGSLQGTRLGAGAANMPKDLAKRIDRWAKTMGKDSHSEAMRHLLEIGLSAPKRKTKK